MVSLILGGGAGTRLYPLTQLRSKPAVPIGGKYRLIDIPISNCLNSGVKRMFVLTQFNSASLNRHIKNTFHFDSFGYGFVDILAAEQTRSSLEWYQGTADAVRQSVPHLKNHDFDYILVLSGDQLYQMDFEKLLDYHIEQAADLTLATIPVNAHDATGFGIMKVNKDGMIDSFVEKPSLDELDKWESPVAPEHSKAGKKYLASMGIYIFSRTALGNLFEQNEKAMDFGKEIIPSAINGDYTVASYAYQGYWTDIGTIRSFFEANLAFTDNVPEFNFFDGDNTVYTRARMLPPSKVFGTKFNKSVLAEGCIVHAKKVERTIVGIRSRIGKKSELKNVIMFGADFYQTIEEMEDSAPVPPIGVGKNCYIEDAILDKNCKIGDNVTIRGSVSLPDSEEEAYCIVNGIVVVKKHGVIPDGTVIGLPKEKKKK
ncbi:MAG: glucose-1-phosphate adenylyltransferase [Bacteroidota bacterium]